MKMYIFCHSDPEASFIKSCVKSTWKTVPDLPVQFNLSHLLKLLSPLHRDRIERILASCLLYSSRYEDTKVMMSEEHQGLRMMMINLRDIPSFQFQTCKSMMTFIMNFKINNPFKCMKHDIVHRPCVRLLIA